MLAASFSFPACVFFSFLSHFLFYSISLFLSFLPPPSLFCISFLLYVLHFSWRNYAVLSHSILNFLIYLTISFLLTILWWMLSLVMLTYSTAILSFCNKHDSVWSYFFKEKYWGWGCLIIPTYLSWFIVILHESNTIKFDNKIRHNPLCL